MKCNNCPKEFLEKEIQLSHDVPKYIGGTDRDGRHYLCQKCHDIYEKCVFVSMVKWLPESIKKHMRLKAKEFAKHFFKKEGENESN